jgi:hypothetical protein
MGIVSDHRAKTDPRTEVGVTWARAASLAALISISTLHCAFDRADRWDEAKLASEDGCTPGEVRCTANLERCVPTATTGAWVVEDDCASRGLVCAPSLSRCAVCLPNERRCDGASVLVCTSDGAGLETDELCDTGGGVACRSGACVNLCGEAAKVKSNVGCEYWAADLDNANINPTSNAAAQQYAVVVSNPQPDVSAHVSIELDDAPRGGASLPRVVAAADISPNNLRVFKLGPREVDGSAEGSFDTGPGTAHTRQAFRVRSSVPVVAYQFNPLDNVNVFSNDASLLKPVEALTMTPGVSELAYVVVGWPQTIAHTNDPDTNFNPADPIDLRAFLTIVATRSLTKVRVTTATSTVAGEDIPSLDAGEMLERELLPFEVLNLETATFGGDFTGSLVEADQPVVVFSGAEAADAPYFEKLADRACCADHLEEQLDPIRTAGTSFIAAHGPNRSRAVAAAGRDIAVVEEPEFYRVVAVSNEGPTHITTTLPDPDAVLELPGRGAHLDLRSERDFMVSTDRPVVFASIQASQDACGVARPLPGGDPSLVIVPPVEQYRRDYVFLTPDKYAFDFIVIMAPAGADVLLDGRPIDEYECLREAADGLTEAERGGPDAPAFVTRCQLSFPLIDPYLPPEEAVSSGDQNDGVHRVQSDESVGVLVYGFDERVSYGYAAGTQLEAITVR